MSLLPGLYGTITICYWPREYSNIQIEGGRHSGLEVEYPGGQKEYTKSRSQIEMKQFYIPADMQGYAVGEYDRVPEQQYIGRLSNRSR